MELACNEEDDHPDCAEATVPAGLALGGLEQAVDGLEEAVGLPGSHPGEDALEMTADHLGDLFHGLDLRAQHVAAPAIEQQVHDVRLLAGEDVAQLLPVVPGARGARGGHSSEESVELGVLRGGELAAILQQHPAQPLEARVELLFDPAHLVDRLGGVGDHVELVEGDLGVGRCDLSTVLQAQMVPQRISSTRPMGDSPVGPQALAALARPLGPAASSAGLSVGCGTVDHRGNRATSGRIAHSKFNRGKISYLPTRRCASVTAANPVANRGRPNRARASIRDCTAVPPP